MPLKTEELNALMYIGTHGDAADWSEVLINSLCSRGYAAPRIEAPEKTRRFLSEPVPKPYGLTGKGLAVLQASTASIYQPVYVCKAPLGRGRPTRNTLRGNPYADCRCKD